MIQTSRSFTRAAVLAVMATALPATAVWAADDYNQTWSSGTRTLGWIKNTGGVVIAKEQTGGNPGGTISSTRSATSKYMGFWSGRTPQLLGNYSGKDWNVEFDLRLAEGTFTAAELHFQFLDGPDDGTVVLGKYRPWTYTLGGALTTASTDWSSHSITFNGSWTDEEAIANGWVLQAKRNNADRRKVVSWATTMSNLYKHEIYLQTSTSFGKAYLDNYVQTDLGAPLASVTAVPEPGTYALMLGGLGLVGFIARRQRRSAA